MSPQPVPDACGCCAGVAARTPRAVANRPGLAALAYRVGTHPDFLASMIAGLTDAGRPRLAALTTRDPDDVSLALLDAWAVVADVLTFYSERLAQESYLRTATQRTSLRELGRLIGYRLRPGVAAQTPLAFALEPSPAVPAASSRDPGAVPPVTPAVVALTAGLRVQSIPGPGELPQTFETVEPIEARPGWNAMPARASRARVPGLGATETWLAGADLGLRPGDALLLAGGDVLDERWDLRVLTAVAADLVAGRTRVRWAEGLGSHDPAKRPADVVEPYVLRRRLRVFGHNAPLWLTMSAGFRRTYPGGASAVSQWPGFRISPAADAVDLDGSHPEVVAGSWVVLSQPSYRELYRVGAVTELSRAAFGTAGAITRLTLAGGENLDLFAGAVRETTVFALSEPLLLAAEPDPTPVAGAHVDVRAEASGLEPGRRVVVAGRRIGGAPHAEAARVAGVTAVDGGSRVALAADLAVAYARESVVVHANVALATHGESVHGLLGSGDASVPFSSFPLARGPLTHVQSAEATGASSTLEVRVNDVAWRERATLFSAGPEERAHAVRVDERDATLVAFGDGVRGARPPTGSQNIRARYRVGSGAAGNVGPEALAQLLDRPLGVKGVSNPLAAAGGVDPEPERAARATMPLAVRTLGRAVSLRDYEDFARAFSGVARALAAVLTLRAGRTVVVTVVFAGAAGPDAAGPDAGGRPAALVASLRAHGDPQVLVAVLSGREHAFRLALRVAVHPDHEHARVLAGVEAALRAAFGRDARELGQPVHRSQVVSVAHSVPGVLGVAVDRLYLGAPGLAQRLVAAAPAVDGAGNARPAGRLVLAGGPLDRLEATG